MNIDSGQLKEFLFKANANGFAGDAQKILPQRPGFTELEYREGDWTFRDSYAGHFFAPGQEIVYLKDNPIWAMAYSGGMKFELHKDSDLAYKTFVFLKEALLHMDKDKPFRGPSNFKKEEWYYISHLKGDLYDFLGNEKIYYQNKLVFEQNFIGGIIV
ncbi:MAG: DUF5680 domain-containing protein [Candidatus Berkelbacteria bacterium]|nr:DUF5680 domain-containing protein [Candidatus Berkelbacteria bacterium]